MTCPVCRDTQRIILPLMAPMRWDYPVGADVPVAQERLSKAYPCPECRSDGYVPVDRICVEQDMIEYLHEYENDPGFIEHVRRSLGHRLAGHIVAHTDVVSYVKGPRDERRNATPMRATMGVVSQSVVKSIEKRISDRQTHVAERAAELAAEAINGWKGDCHYIKKTEAVAAVRGAVKHAIDIFFSKGAIDR